MGHIVYNPDIKMVVFQPIHEIHQKLYCSLNVIKLYNGMSNTTGYVKIDTPNGCIVRYLSSLL